MILKNELNWIWETYKRIREGDLVIRSGFGLCGVYEYDVNSGKNYRHPESDSEHINGCIEIARNLSRFNPNLFTAEEWFRIFDLLKYHDLGEINYGDHPDDGTQNADEKNNEELTTFTEIVSHLPEEHAKSLIQDFKAFQNLNLGIMPDAPLYRVASFSKLCDKLDAVLKAIIYELNGVGGNLSYKEFFYGSISDRDKFYVRYTGTGKIAPNWAIHFLDSCHKYPHFVFFFGILRAAVYEVNDGHFYNWLDIVQKDFNISNEDLYYYLI